MTLWLEKYEKDITPSPEDALDFLPESVSELLRKYISFLHVNLKIYFLKACFSKKYGWKFRFGRGKVVLTNIIINKGSFSACDIDVKTPKNLDDLIDFTNEKYNNGFEEAYKFYVEKKTTEQANEALRTGKWKRIGWKDEIIIKE